MAVELKTPVGKPLRLGYFDPVTGLRQFVEDGQGKRMYGLSGQAFLRAVVERESANQNENPSTPAEKRRREKYGSHYLDSEIILANGTKTTRKKRLLERVDSYSARAISQTYQGISAEQAGDFYEKRMRDANNFVYDYVDMLFPAMQDIVGLNNDARLISPRRTVILDLLAQNLDAHLFFEAQRHIVLTNIAAELSERAKQYSLKEQVIAVQRALTSELFKQPFGHTEYADTYAVYDKATNYVVSVNETVPSYDPEKQVVRHVQKRMRQIPITEEGEVVEYQPVLCEVRLKSRESEILKGIKKAEERRQKGKGDEIRIGQDVNDTMGLMFVVKGTMDSFDPKVNQLAQKVGNFIRTKWPEAQFKPKHITRADGTQSPDQRYQRYEVFLQDNSSLPFEMIFYGEGDYLNSEGEIGKRSELLENGTMKVEYNGRAHDLYKMRQGIRVLDIVMPPSIPFYNGRLNLRRMAYRSMDEKAEEIRKITQKEIINDAVHAISEKQVY